MRIELGQRIWPVPRQVSDKLISATEGLEHPRRLTDERRDVFDDGGHSLSGPVLRSLHSPSCVPHNYTSVLPALCATSRR